MIQPGKLVYLGIAIVLTLTSSLLTQVHHMGFTCGDPKLSHKYNGDTVPPKHLLVISYLLPTLVLINKYFHKNSYVEFFKMYILFTIGYCLCISSVDFLKNLFGEPRPHFFDTCKPKEADNCIPGTFISQFNCTNTNLKQGRDSIKSFPSGHSALSTFSAVYVLLYILKKSRCTSKRVIQILCIAWISACTISRIFDNRHHWWDVVSGTVYGGGLSLLIIK